MNLGSSDSGGESVATVAWGFRYRILKDLDFGAVGEMPVTGRRDIFGWRVTTDIIWRPMGWYAIL